MCLTNGKLGIINRHTDVRPCVDSTKPHAYQHSAFQASVDAIGHFRHQLGRRAR